MKNTNHSKLSAFLRYIEKTWNLQICIKDFIGFIPIDRSLSDALYPYLGHNNAYCVYVKNDKERYRHCLSMMKKIAMKAVERGGESFFGVCYAGVGEFVIPIMSEGQLLGAITAGFIAQPEEEVRSRIAYAMGEVPQVEIEMATNLYRQSITPALASKDEILSTLEFVAGYLAQSYHSMQQSGDGKLIARRRNNNTEEVFKQFLSYVHAHYTEKLTIMELSVALHCSESYLNHMIKKKTGVTFSTYMNKLRVEHAKQLMLDTNDSILSIAMNVGYADASYFSRVFMQLMDISPSEFRRRYR
ncbi:MAG: helix-turn-helix domain-containing protein [Sphingobacteriia bacterium]|nr:helix-turn-helix domain-containing protein [Sphingobacteriia bacterium]